MPKLPSTAVPAYCLHRASGQAVVTLGGRDIYLGVHGSPASKAEYDRRIAEWVAAGRRVPVEPQSLTVLELIAAYLRHARSYYRGEDGKKTKATTNIEESLKPVLKLYGRTPAMEFGPLKLKTIREAMIAEGRVRTNINRHVVRIRGAFKWAVENEMIPPTVLHGLMSVPGLRVGRSGAKEPAPVRPVAREHVEAVAEHVSRQVAAMLRLQMITGMRPGEVCSMRTGDIDTTGTLWVYRPQHHKTKHHGHHREIFIGPKAREILKPFLKRDLAAYIFSPADAEAERRASLHTARKTPLSCGSKPGSNKRRKPKRIVGQWYTPLSYYCAIRRGCEKAYSEMAPAAIALRPTISLPTRKVVRQ